MNLRIPLASLAVAVGLATAAQAQFKHPSDNAKGPKLGEATVQRWKAGMIITAEGGPCIGLSGSAPIPFDWPEQQVTIVGEDLSPQVKLSYETVNGTAKRMQVKIDQIPAGQEVKAIITVEVRRWILLPPDNTDIYELPDKHKIDKNLRIYLAPSKLIESTNPKIKSLARKLGVDKEKAWDHVEEIYDWVREHVKYQAGPIKGALAALRDGTGDCEEVTSLFVAICRAADIPARSVWVPGHCYPEFYLVRRRRQGPLVSLPVGRQPGLRRHPQPRPDPAKGRQLQGRPRVEALPGRRAHRRRLRRQAQGEVHPRAGAVERPAARGGDGHGGVISH